MPVYEPEKQGLPKGANQLLFNDGTVVGRCSAARKIVGEPGCNLSELLPIIREAVYNTRYISICIRQKFWSGLKKIL
jgi:phosphoenolpyruvate carboxykinase (ATP)